MKTYLLHFRLLGHGTGSATFNKESDRMLFISLLRDELVTYSVGIGDADGKLVGVFSLHRVNTEHYE